MMMPGMENEDGEVELVQLNLPLDRQTIAWLNKLAKNDTQAAAIIASMLRDIRIDDEQAHRVLN